MRIRIRDLEIFFNPGSGMEQIPIRDKHPGSATLAQRRISLIISLVTSVVDPVWFIPDPNPTFQVISDPILKQGHEQI
jgi:hypothetical protein